ncbi:MAG: ribosome maturation factor RimP [Bacillota bacterium]
MKKGQGGSQIASAREIAARTAEALNVELVEVTLQKEADGFALCIYIDKESGVTLDDCERFHKAVQPLLDEIEYEYLEVSSPGADRPIQTPRDVEKRCGDRVEVRLFAKLDGEKQFTGTLAGMDDAQVVITTADGQTKSFPRKSVALVKPVITVSEEE